VRLDDLCRKHYVEVVGESNAEPIEPLYMVEWETYIQDCYRIANMLLFGLGDAVVEACQEKGIYVGEPEGVLGAELCQDVLLDAVILL
jgi:hypothetical protein